MLVKLTPGVNRCSDGADRLREHWDQVMLQIGYYIVSQVKRTNIIKTLNEKFEDLRREN